jgi:hypothetical protein
LHHIFLHQNTKSEDDLHNPTTTAMKLNGIAGWTAALWIGRNALAQEYDAIAGWAPLSNVTKHVRGRRGAQSFSDVPYSRVSPPLDIFRWHVVRRTCWIWINETLNF